MQKQKHLAPSKAIPYVVVVHVNGSHLIKNYLIMILALIRYARFSLSRAPQPCRRSYFFLSRIHLVFTHRPLTVSITLQLPPPPSLNTLSTLRSHLLEASVLVALFSLFFRRSFLGAASLSSLLSFLVEYRITDELTFRQRVHTVKS